MSKTYRPYDPDQQLMLPAALQEWLPTDHLNQSQGGMCICLGAAIGLGVWQ